ncbi:hypothetical protein PINS_up023636 [Pythium insidiosum]|nr:hypothetical protein PINS_up023636 [Pythium insidiosum]
MEPRMPSLTCTLKCCAGANASASSGECACLAVSKFAASAIDEDAAIFDTPYPEEEEFDDDFDLGPPPPSGPVLVRQNATDLTAAMESKFSMASSLKLNRSGNSLPSSRPVLARSALSRT